MRLERAGLALDRLRDDPMALHVVGTVAHGNPTCAGAGARAVSLSLAAFAASELVSCVDCLSVPPETALAEEMASCRRAAALLGELDLFLRRAAARHGSARWAALGRAELLRHSLGDGLGRSGGLLDALKAPLATLNERAERLRADAALEEPDTQLLRRYAALTGEIAAQKRYGRRSPAQRYLRHVEAGASDEEASAHAEGEVRSWCRQFLAAATAAGAEPQALIEIANPLALRAETDPLGAALLAVIGRWRVVAQRDDHCLVQVPPTVATWVHSAARSRGAAHLGAVEAADDEVVYATALELYDRASDGPTARLSGAVELARLIASSPGGS